MEAKKVVERVIELKNVTKVFGKETVVDDVNLNIKRGEFVTLLGPSGCGKTTMLRMIAGFEMPTEGKIMLEGVDVSKTPPHLRNVNTVFQKYALFPHLDVYGNVAFGLKLKLVPLTDEEKHKALSKLKGKPESVIAKREEALNKKTRPMTKDEIRAMVTAKLKLVGLEGYEKRDVDSLSGGQQQRVAIARALVNQPKVLLLDEPLGALDLKMRKEMQAELKAMHKELGITFLYVTHDQEEAMAMSDRIVVVSDGKIQQVGTPKQIYEEPVNAFVADFIGESNILAGTMLADFKVQFLGNIFKCADKGFAKNQAVDIVIRPEDIILHKPTSSKAMIKGKVISSTFKGMHYELVLLCKDYEVTVHTQTAHVVGVDVGMEIREDEMHVMRPDYTINEYLTHMASDEEVLISCEKFGLGPVASEKGAPVRATIPFDRVQMVDDEKDGIVAGTVTHTLYRGRFNRVTVWTDADERFIVDTEVEWDIGDRVGIVVLPEDIQIEAREEVDE